MKNETTGKEAAAIAARVLRANIADDDSGMYWARPKNGNKKLFTFSGSELKALAASALTQAKDRPSAQLPGLKKRQIEAEFKTKLKRVTR